MKRFLPFVIVMALVWAGCGGKKSSTSTTVAVTISPTTASIAGGATQQFTATVTGSTNTAVTWNVNGTVGGNSSVGTISTTGLYTAPTVLPTTTTVAVNAVAQTDNTTTATATVTLTAPPITIAISPTTVVLGPGATQQFTATVTGGATNAVTWSVPKDLNGGSALGTVDANGNYTAPLSPPKEAITVTATSNDNTAFTAKANVTVQFGTASLKGAYVFLATQRDDSSSSGFALNAGTFFADGVGKITAGTRDANSSAGGSSGTSGIPFTGIYSVGADGRGTVTMSDTGTATIHTFAFALTSNSRGQLIEFDTSGVTAGYIRQQPTAIATVGGSFVFNLSGDNAGPFAAVGQISFSGGASGTVTGTEDANNLGVEPVQPFSLSGNYSVAAGRGNLTLSSQLGTQNFVFYVIDASTLTLIDVDATGVRPAGTAYAQSIGGFTNASLGSSVYFTSGNISSVTKPYGQVGRFDTNPAAGQFLNGVFDTNNAGTVTSSAAFPTGATYSVSSTGRGTITGISSAGTVDFIFYLASPGQGVILQTDPGIIASGLLLQQQTGFQAVTGGFEFVVSGANAAGTTALAINAQTTTSGLGVLTGTEDVNATGGPLTTTASPAVLTGGFAIGPDGRAVTGNNNNITGTQNPGTPSARVVSSDSYVFYFVSQDRFFMLTTDSTNVLSGVAERQCSDCTF